MKYSINWMERKTTSTGKNKIDANLIAEDGSEVRGVTIWADFTGFETLMSGGQVEGTLSPAKDPKFGPTLYPIKVQPATRGSNYGVKAAQERKAEHIEEAQENKFNHIREAAAQRDAVLIVTTFYKDSLTKGPLLSTELDAIVKTKIEAWRTYFLNQSEQTPF